MMEEPQDKLLQFGDQQRMLYKSLNEKNPSLRIIYHGALVVLSDKSNPDSLPLAAHGLRELLEKIPRWLDVPILSMKESLKEKVIWFEETWDHTIDKCPRHKNGEWSGEIDKFIKKLFKCLHEFFTWFKAHHPRRKKEVTSLLRRLDSSGRQLPEPLEKLNVDYWYEIDKFFKDVAHHRRNPTEAEFNNWLDALERFLLDRLCPRTFDDFNAIDAILKETESDDKT